MGGGNKQVTCTICLKTMRSDHLKRHMKQHVGEIRNVDEAETHRSGTSLGKCTSLNFEKLKKNVLCQADEFNRKIELGRQLKIIINEEDLNIHALDSDMKEALKTYELYGKNMDMEEINWRGWQMDLRQYLDKPCNRKIIWVVGTDGNEGKSFFQRNICEEFGYSRVCRVELIDARDTFHIVGKEFSSNTDIFLFNLSRCDYLSTKQYKLLESIKDGTAMNGNLVSNLKKPNVFIVFANREPDREKLSEDRWIILKISEDLTSLKEITDDSCMVKKKKKKMVIESDESEDGGLTDDCL